MIALRRSPLAVLAIAMWTVRGGSAPMPAHAAGRFGGHAGGAGRARSSRSPASNLEALQARASRTRRQHAQSVQVQAEAAATPPPQPTAVDESAGPLRLSRAGRHRRHPPRIALKFIGDMANPQEAGRKDRGAQRRTQRAIHGREGEVIEGPISDIEDRRRIGRACVSRRARAPNHQTNRTISHEMRRLTRVFALLLAFALLTGCAAGQAFSTRRRARHRLATGTLP